MSNLKHKTQLNELEKHIKEIKNMGSKDLRIGGIGRAF